MLHNAQRTDHSIKQWIYKYQFNKKQELVKGPKIGLIIGLRRNDGTIGIGWSKCASKDKFNKTMAERIACGRSILWDWDESQENTPFAIKKYLEPFRQRVKTYFKIES